MASTATIGTCPFCGFTDADEYILLLHVETLHSEGDSPFVVREDLDGRHIGIHGLPESNETSASHLKVKDVSSEDYVTCPEAECGEAILLSEIDTHMDMHVAEKLTVDDDDMGDDHDDGRNKKKQKTGHHHCEGSDAGHTSPHPSTKSPSPHHSSTPRGWRTFLIGTGSSKSYVQSQEPNTGGVKRLGVCLLFPLRSFLFTKGTHIPGRKQSSVHMHMKSRCPVL